jgi:hypothetical protein
MALVSALVEDIKTVFCLFDAHVMGPPTDLNTLPINVAHDSCTFISPINNPKINSSLEIPKNVFSNPPMLFLWVMHVCAKNSYNKQEIWLTIEQVDEFSYKSTINRDIKQFSI